MGLFFCTLLCFFGLFCMGLFCIDTHSVHIQNFDQWDCFLDYFFGLFLGLFCMGLFFYTLLCFFGLFCIGLFCMGLFCTDTKLLQLLYTFEDLTHRMFHKLNSKLAH